MIGCPTLQSHLKSRKCVSTLQHGSGLHHCGKMKHGGIRRNRDFLMIDAVLAKIFGTQNERDVKALRPRIVAINALEPEIEQLSDIDLAAKTIEFKERLAQGATLDDLLVEAFAILRAAGRRRLNMRHFYE